jgi:hypothetical protein
MINTALPRSRGSFLEVGALWPPQPWLQAQLQDILVRPGVEKERVRRGRLDLLEEEATEQSHPRVFRESAHSFPLSYSPLKPS